MRFLILIYLFCCSTITHGVFFSSADLYQWLENDLNGIETYEGGMGKGYLMGVVDMLAGTIPRTVCYPSGISALKLKLVVFEYMHNNPEFSGQPPDKVVYQALTKEWPCK